MAVCSHCGSDVPAGVKFCVNCGAPAAQATPPAAAQAPSEPAHAAAMPEAQSPVLKTGAFFWSLVAMNLPGIGLIISIIWACGGCKNLNRRNLARGTLLYQVIILALTAVLGAACYFLFGGQITEIVSSVQTW